MIITLFIHTLYNLVENISTKFQIKLIIFNISEIKERKRVFTLEYC